MGTFVKVFSTLSPLEIDKLIFKQACLVSSQSNQRPTMNMSIIFAVLAILAQFAENNASPVCPDNFPTIERHSQANHGDVCRNKKRHGFNVGWVCPVGCKESPSRSPWCSMSSSSNTPCRIKTPAPTTGKPQEASESNKDWCCKVVMVHQNIPGKSWGRLAMTSDGDEGLRKEWDNKGCNTLVANGGDGHNTNNCPSNFDNKDWCCAASDLYKGKEKGGFNKIDLSTKTSNHPVKLWWDKKRCSEHNSNCSA